ncbi:MAG: tryptophan 2,3-dioxygenase family protein [Saprospiraceae bacterium]
MPDQKYATIHYHSYLQLDKILSAQVLRSAQVEPKPAHEEMLFIIIHQVYELWFKQIAHEVGSVVDMFRADNVDERSIGTAVGRLNRVIEIQKLLVQQIQVLETMTPLDFLDFRNYLFPASGFQSHQFRKVEVMLGLADANRITYNNKPYTSEFTENQQHELLAAASPSLFDLVEDWLERTPFLHFGSFEFLTHYRQAVQNMLARERQAIEQSHLTDSEKAMRLQMLGGTDTYFQSVLAPEAHSQMQAEGKLRLSYRATIAALFINLYRDEPMLHMPFNLLQCLVEIDELLTTWRYRHAQMVLRMLGRKIGTGGSSGHDYLHATAVKHHIFSDLHNISTLLIPRSELPALPDEVRRELGFFYTEKK